MKFSSLDNLAETLSFCILKKGKIENFGYVLQHVSRWALKGICLVNGSLVEYEQFSYSNNMNNIYRERERERETHTHKLI